MKNANLNWRFRGNENRYLNEILIRGLKPKKSFNLFLEKKWSKFHKIKYSITVNSCTSALHVALLAIGCKAGDEVLVPALTPVMCANSIIFTGATPIFVDVSKESFLMDIEDLKKKITKKTKAILLVHMYGGVNNLLKFKKIANKHKIKIVEDCAESLGAKDENNILAGKIGDISCWSFQSAKHLTCGDGGILSTSNRFLAERARKFSNLGFKFLKANADKLVASKNKLQRPSTTRFELIGYNYRMNEFSAAIALAQFERLKFFLKLRRKVSLKLLKLINKSAIIKSQNFPKKTYSTFYTLTAKIINEKVNWKKFREIFINFGGDPIYAASKILQDEPSIKFSGFGRCFNTCDKKCLIKCTGTPNAKYLQKRILAFCTNQSTAKNINKQFYALKKTLDYFENKKI
jgi:perosamine synthetase